MLSRRFLSAVALSAPLLGVYCFAQVSPSNQFITVKTNSTNGTPVAVADFNRDGKPDVLLFGDFPSGNSAVSLALLLNNGNGTFTMVPIANSPVIDDALDLQPFYAVADVNGDGIPDIIISDPHNFCGYNGQCEAYGGEVYVLLGQGNGYFNSPEIYGSGQDVPTPSSFAVADVNNDGYPDLVVLTAPQSPASVPYGKVQVLLNDGHGKFTEGKSFTSSMAQIYGTGDFTNDGREDIVGATALSSSYTQTLQIFKNLGAGSLQMVAQDPEPAITGAGVADLNHDGKTDLILAETTRAVVLLSNGDYTFHNGTGPLILPLSSGSLANPVPPSTPVVIGDFNHDGHPDFIVGQQVFFGNGDGTVTASKIYSPGYVFSPASSAPQNASLAYTGALFTADFDGDGNLDIVGISDSNIVFWSGNRNGIFDAPLQTLTRPGIQDMITGDFNRDGIQDLAVITQQSRTSGGANLLSIYPGTGKGYFDPPTISAFSGASAIAGDINNDGYPEIVGVNDHSTYLEDVNHDGKLDLVSGAGVLLGNGNGTFQTTLHPLPISGTPEPNEVTAMAFGDFNGDGKLDIAVLTAPDPNLEHIPVTLYLLLGNGDGTFRQLSSTPASSLDLDRFGGGIALVDLNHDGHLDLVYTGLGTDSQGGSEGELLVQLGDGKGNFATPIRQVVITAAMTTTMNIGTLDNSLLLADFDRDGNLDAAVPTNNGFIQYLRGLGNGKFAAPASYMIDSGHDDYYYNNYFSYYAVIDINGDGYPDIVKTLLTGQLNSSPTEDAVTRLINSGAHTTPPK